MRAPNRESLLPYLVLLLLLPASNAITLSQFQQVAGFSKACTDAYNTPLTACTPSDFVDGQACSLDCINFLKNLTVSINKACEGTKAFPETLIGMVFSGDAVAVLCPNVLALTSSKPSSGITGGNGDGVGATAATSTLFGSLLKSFTTPVAQSPATKTTKASTTIPSSSSASSNIPPATSSTLEPIDTSTTVFMISTTVDPNDDPTALPSESTVPLSALTAIASSTATHVAEPTSSGQKQKNNPGGAGGGTLFDIASSSSHNAQILWWATSILVGVLTLVCII